MDDSPAGQYCEGLHKWRVVAAQACAFATLNQLMPVALADLRVWAEDIGFVLDALEVVNQSDALLAVSLNLERVGVMGSSKRGRQAHQFRRRNAVRLVNATGE